MLRNRYVWLALLLCAGLLLLTYFVPLLRGLLGLQRLPLHSLWYVLVPPAAVLVLGQLLGRMVGRLWPPAPTDLPAPVQAGGPTKTETPAPAPATRQP